MADFNPLPSYEGRRTGRSIERWEWRYFNPLPSCEGRLDNGEFVGAQGPFQSTPLTRGETFNPASISTSGTNFNPLPSHEGRHFMRRKKRRERDFNPLPSHEGRRADGRHAALPRYFNPLPSHEGRRSLYCLRVIGGISIHSPHTRGDKHRPEAGSALTISIHSPHTRGDHGAPERGAQKRISIHSPHTRGDDGSAGTARGRLISIHSPHTRGDPSTHGVLARGCHFNPLPSHEGRRRILVLADSSSSFQSTPLTRGETSSTTRTPPHF